MPYLTQQLGPQGAAVTSTLLGAAVGGGAGASTASAGAIYNDMHHYSDYQAELSACQSNPSGTGCGTILSMYGNESVPLSLPDSNNPSGVIANINTQTGQVVSYTLTNDQNQPVLIIQPSDYQNYLTLVEHDNYFYNAIGNYSPEYALQASNFLTDLENGNPSQAGGNLAGMFTNGSYWRDMGIGMAGAAGAYASSVTPALATEADSVAANAGSLANQTTSTMSSAIANATADAEAGTSVTITNTTNSAIATTPEIGAGNGVATDTTVTSEGTANSATLQGLKDQLLNENLTNIAAQDPRLAAAVNGSGTNNINFSIGTGTATEADSLGQIWVGDGARPMNGVPGGLVSADGTRVYRPPTVKPNTPAQFAPTGVQANFQQLQNGVVISNGHLNITKP